MPGTVYLTIVGPVIVAWLAYRAWQRERSKEAGEDCRMDVKCSVPDWLDRKIDDLWPVLERLAYRRLRYRYLHHSLIAWLTQSNERHWLAQKAVATAFAAICKLHPEPIADPKELLETARRETLLAVLALMKRQDRRIWRKVWESILLVVANIRGR